MKICEGFELVNVADEHIVVPIGEKAESFMGVVVINDAVAFLLENMKNNQTIDELVSSLTEHYDVERDRAYEDITSMLDTLYSIGLICE